jgi:hypothetical protein
MGKTTTMRTTKLYYRVDRRQINMIRFIFEAYEGIAVATTLDAAAGLIVLSVAPGCEKTAGGIMKDMGKDFLVESIPPVSNGSARGVHENQISVY